MESIILAAIAVVVLGVIWKFWPKGNGLDVNQDGKVDVKDAEAGLKEVAAKVEEEVKVEVKKVVAKAKAAADLNKDGKVDVADAKVAVAKVKKVATKAKETAVAVEKTVAAKVTKTKKTKV